MAHAAWGSLSAVACPRAFRGYEPSRLVEGLTMAQDRLSSEFFEMPSAAIDFAKPEVMAPERMAGVLKIIAASGGTTMRGIQRTQRLRS
jgi:hypothetical protein